MELEKKPLDIVKLVSNIALVVLVSGNIFFGIQYIAVNKLQSDLSVQNEAKESMRLQASRFMKYYIDVVLSTKGTISFEDRVKLENDVLQMHDADITAKWNAFVKSKDSQTAQDTAVKLMSTLATKML